MRIRMQSIPSRLSSIEDQSALLSEHEHDIDQSKSQEASIPIQDR